MPEFLFEQQPTMEHGTDMPRLSFSQNDAMFTEVPSLEEMSAHWGINNIDTRMLSAVKVHFNPGNEDTSLDSELMKMGNFDANDPFTITKFIGPGVFYKGLAWSIECAKANCTTFDLVIVRASNGDVIHEFTDISASDGSVFNGDMLAKPEFIGSGEAFLLKIRFTSLPYINDDDTLTWGNECNPPPCMGIRVHALTEDSCLAQYNTGCGISGDCCSGVPEEKCCEPKLAASCA